MTTRIIIARHGNTFRKDETPRRIGTTDLPLVEETRGRAIGQYLIQNHVLPQAVFAAPLQRTMQTAQLAVQEMKHPIPIIALQEFAEIDYGEDENQTEDAVISRIGKNALELWNQKAVVPQGWHADPAAIIAHWEAFAQSIEKNFKGNNVLIVSSNGIIRFAPCLTGDLNSFIDHFDIKVGTGNICIFKKTDNNPQAYWTCSAWNKKIYDNTQK